jgi:ABC-type phosphate transport system substrate-binding protein
MNPKYLASTFLAAALSFSAAHAATITINAGGSSLAYPTYVAEFAAFTKANPTILFSYEGVGSGAGQNAFLKNDITYFEPNPPNANGYAAGTLTYGTIVGTSVAIGASDATLSNSQLTAPATGSYANSSADGPLIQIPTIGVPITMAFNETAETGTLSLTDSQICGVLSGKITDWHTLVSTIPAGTTITVVYRSDGSGTTFLTTQHLNAVCTAANSNFVIPVAITKTFASLFTSDAKTNNKVPSTFVAESGSGGVATEAASVSGSFAYLSPDYTAIAPKSANYNAKLKVASVYNSVSEAYYTPSVANTETALQNPGTGSANGSPPPSLAAAQDPLNWVPTIPQPTKGYPIVGYTTMDLSTCYANQAIGTAIIKLLTDAYTVASYSTIITNNGFAPLSNTGAAKFATAINADFLTNSSGYALNIDNATTCASYTGR